MTRRRNSGPIGFLLLSGFMSESLTALRTNSLRSIFPSVNFIKVKGRDGYFAVGSPFRAITSLIE